MRGRTGLERDPWIGELPGGWSLKRLGALGSLTKGRGGSKEDNRDSGIPVVRYGDLYTKFGTTITEPAGFVDGSDASRYTALPHNAIVFAASGEAAEDIGKSALSLLPDPALVGGDTVVLRPGSDVYPSYLAYALESSPIRSHKAFRSTGFTVVHISASRLKTIPIPLPSLPVQRAIAEHLDRETTQIDALIERQRALIDRLRERREAVQIAIALGHGAEAARESGLPWASRVPAHWEVVPLTSVSALGSGHTPSKTRPELWSDAHIPWISLRDVGAMAGREYIYNTHTNISHAGIAASSARLLPAETVVLSRDATIGRSAIMGAPMATSQHFVTWTCGPRLLPSYLWLILTGAMQPFFESLTDGATLRTIGMGDVRSFRIPLPPLAEQEELPRRARVETDKIDTLIAKAARFIELARERRSALITAAVTGQIDVEQTAVA